MKSDNHRIDGIAAAIPLANLDTDQIMPKQFLRGIDKSGLDRGVLYDMRFDETGQPRPDFILNQHAFRRTQILLGGPNFGCGSSREHAVWGLLQFGIKAIIASSFGEIFYSNAMNNGLLLVALDVPQVTALMADVAAPETARLTIDLQAMVVRSHQHEFSFGLSPRHREMFLQGQDLIGASMTHLPAIDRFAQEHWQRHPWMKDVARQTRSRLDTVQS